MVTQEVREVREDVDRSLVVDLESEARAHRTVVIGRFGIGSEARAGADVEMHVDARRLHFFDLDSEQAIEGPPGRFQPVPGRVCETGGMMDDGVVDRLRVLGSRRTSSCTGSAASGRPIRISARSFSPASPRR